MKYIILIIALSFTVNCGTLFSSSHQQVRITKTKGTTVTVNGVNTSSSTVLIKRGNTCHVIAKNSNGDRRESMISTTVNGVSFLNMLCVLCWGVDFATGKVYSLDSNHVDVSF